MKNELLKKGKNEIELSEKDRVDFNSLTSILNYGENILNQIQGLTESVVNMKGNTINVAITDEKEALQKVSTFSEYAKEEAEKKKASSKSLLSKIREWISSSEENEEVTFKELYDKYLKIIEDVKRDIQKNMETTREEIDLAEGFMNELTPGLLKLKALLDLGHADLEAYRNHLYLPLKENYAKNQYDSELRYQVSVVEQVIDVFSNRLNELEGAYQVLTNSRIESQAIKAGNMNLLIVYQGIISTSLPVLEIAAINSVSTEIQRKKVDNIVKRRKEINETIVNNSNTLLNNLERISDEYSHATIESATIETLLANSQQIVEKLNNAILQRRENNIHENALFEKNIVLLEKQTAIIDSISFDLSQNKDGLLPEYTMTNNETSETETKEENANQKKKSLFRK